MKNFIYLVQGQAKMLQNPLYVNLKNRTDIDTVLLTYDEPLEGAIFLPNSTWAQGRNRLQEEALKGDYRYYIFLDDDLCFVNGNFALFEKQLLKYNPAVAMPVFVPKTAHTVLGIGIPYNGKFCMPFKYQLCRLGDAQLMAVHKDVILDRLIAPLQTQFDNISWWFTSSTQQLLIFNLYPDTTLQFNKIAVENGLNREYPNNKFKHIQKEWLARQFIEPVYDPRVYIINLCSRPGIQRLFKSGLKKELSLKYIKTYTRTLWDTWRYKRSENHQFREDKIRNVLQADSELLQQHLIANR